MSTDADTTPEDTGPDETAPDDAHVESRAHLLPEEKAAGSADPTAQAEEILVESEDRTEHPEETGAASSQTVPEV